MDEARPGVAARSGEGGRGAVALVTGATGFVGGHLVEALVARGARVRCLVRPSSDTRWLPAHGVTLARGDVHEERDARALADAVRGVDVVYHLAALTSAATDSAYDRVNVGGTRRVGDAMRAAAPGARMVLCSSLAAAGPARGGRPLTEDEAPCPLTAYGRSKLAAERVVNASGLRHAVVRPPTVYGPRDADIRAAFRLAARGLAVRVGPATQRLSMIHVADLAAALLLAGEHERAAGGTYFVTDGVVHTWEEVVGEIAAAVGRRVRRLAAPRAAVTLVSRAGRLLARATGRKPLLTPDRVRDLAEPDWTCDDTRARRELGFAARIALRQGIRDTAAWYRREGWL